MSGWVTVPEELWTKMVHDLERKHATDAKRRSRINAARRASKREPTAHDHRAPEAARLLDEGRNAYDVAASLGFASANAMCDAILALRRSS